MKRIAQIADAIINTILGDKTPVTVDLLPAFGRKLTSC
jgi:hypothetical protein